MRTGGAIVLVAVLLMVPSTGRAPAAVAPQLRPVLVTLGDQAELTNLPKARAARLAAIKRILQDTAASSQSPVLSLLAKRKADGLVTRVRPLWVTNAIAVNAAQSVVDELRALPDVASVEDDSADIAPASDPEPNVALIGAPVAWQAGDRGEGVVVASLDTGVDVTHPDLAGSWRGGSNSWFDAYGEHTAGPVDLSGHGTHAMGVMVAGDMGGTGVGVAPGARWIAARIFDDRGRATTSAIHLAFQWLLDPDGDPATPDAPRVVNNSWSMTTGCDLEFEPDIVALRAAGILPVFAAGNSGPSSGSNVSPADNPGAIAVGATTTADTIALDSGRGPATCGGPPTEYPTLTAPGVNVRTTDLLSRYTTASGTSLAAPHVAAALALLLSAHPGLSADQQEQALRSTAVDLGAPGPDDTFGDGRLDAAAALASLADTTGPGVSDVAYGVDTGTLTATAADLQSTVAAGEWFLDVDPGAGAGTPMDAADGAFDSQTEGLAAAVAALTPGDHTLGVRARDAAGNWGAAETVGITVASNEIFSDGFASGDTSAWSSVRRPAHIHVVPGAALDAADGYGMAADLGAWGTGVADSSPAAEPTYVASFLFDPASASTAGRPVTIFLGRDGNDHRLFVLRFKTVDDRIAVRAAGAGKPTRWAWVSPGAHRLELRWAASPAAIDLLVDGLQVGASTGATDAAPLEAVALGPAAGHASSASGTLAFDGFSSQRAPG